MVGYLADRALFDGKVAILHISELRAFQGVSLSTWPFESFSESRPDLCKYCVTWLAKYSHRSTY